MNPASFIVLASFLAGVGAGPLLAVTPDVIRSGRLIRYYLQTRDRKRAVELYLAATSNRRKRHRQRRPPD